MTTRTRNLTLALVACAALLVTAVAVPATAQPYERSSKADDRASDQGRYDAAKDKYQKYDERRDAFKERCTDANESDLEQCKQAKNFHDHASKARREAHAIMGAIRAVEHRIAKLEMMELRANMALEGNVSDEQEESILEKIERIDNAQQKLAERLMHLYKRLDALKDRWQAVRDHVSDKRGDWQDDSEADGETDEDESSTDDAAGDEPSTTAAGDDASSDDDSGDHQSDADETEADDDADDDGSDESA